MRIRVFGEKVRMYLYLLSTSDFKHLFLSPLLKKRARFEKGVVRNLKYISVVKLYLLDKIRQISGLIVLGAILIIIAAYPVYGELRCLSCMYACITQTPNT